MRRRLLGLLIVVAGVGASTAGAQQGKGEITGVVVDSLGSAIVGAQVFVPSAGTSAVSDVEGKFRLRNIPEGTAEVTARRLGFAAASLKLSVEPGRTTTARLVLALLPASLQVVTVRERRTASDQRLAGFYARAGTRARGGHFVTRDQLDRFVTNRLADVLSEIPGVRVLNVRGARQVTIRSSGTACTPLFYIDGFPASAGAFDVDMIGISSVEGIEVYESLSSVPPELLGPRGLDRCGVIAIWSRPAPSRRTAAVRGVEDIAQLVARHEVFTADDVDERATPIDSVPTPVYPDSLWRARVGGRAVIELLVDSLGDIEPGSVRVVTATSPLFGVSARRAVESVSFRPAKRQHRPVRQVVQLQFIFAPSNSPTPAPDDRIH